jgi:hypothetical protein
MFAEEKLGVDELILSFLKFFHEICPTFVLIISPLVNCAGSSGIINCLECIFSWLLCNGKCANLDV